KVNQPSSLTDPITPLPTASEFHLRLLVHVDDIGTARLLQKVLLMWKNGTYTNNPAGVQVLDQPGHYVLVSDDRFIPQFTGSALRDNEPVARRFSSTAFAIRNPLPFAGTGDFGSANTTLTNSITLDYDDPLNPFKHQYHPDHNNLDEHFEQKLPEGIES